MVLLTLTAPPTSVATMKQLWRARDIIQGKEKKAKYVVSTVLW